MVRIKLPVSQDPAAITADAHRAARVLQSSGTEMALSLAAWGFDQAGNSCLSSQAQAFLTFYPIASVKPINKQCN